MNTQRIDVDDGYETDAMYHNPLTPAFPDQLGVLSSTRAVAPLKPARDAVGLDTTALNQAEQVARVVALARDRLPH